ncbi:MAG: nuclear transport factor 2 family protein, partial [Gemmatimonadaceae bacterium]
MSFGHYALALGAKRATPRTSLGVLFAAAPLPAWRGSILATLWSSLMIAGVPAVANAQSALSRQFQALLTSEYTATVHGDTATLGRRLADDLVWINGQNGGVVTKSQLLAAVAPAAYSGGQTFIADSVHATRFGDVATVEYLRHDTWPMGRGVITDSWRALDVFAYRAGRWQVVRHTQVWLVSPVTPITLDSVALSAFVGRYQIRPGYVDNVHFEGGVLVATASGQSVGAHLVPVSSSAFSPDGTGAIIVFERDSTGRVLGYAQGY